MTIVYDFFLELVAGRAQLPNGDLLGQQIQKGFNPTVNSSIQTIQPQGGNIIFPTTPQRVRVAAGGDPSDDAAGLGARTVQIEGIKADGLYSSETLTLAGALASNWSVESYWRVYSAEVITVGTYGGDNNDLIQIENEVDTDVLIIIPAESGSSEFCHWCSPVNEEAYVTSAWGVVEKNTSVNLRIRTRQNFTTTSGDMSPILGRSEFGDLSQGLTYLPLRPYSRVPPLTDVWIEGARQDGGAATEVSAGFTIITVPVPP